MKTFVRILCAVLLVSMLAGCTGNTGPNNTQPTGDTKPLEVVDYAGSIKLDMDTSTAKAEVTVKSYVDGDTTHFNCDPKVNPEGVLKIRYLAVNTPESTGKIEEWGKKASNFTKGKLYILFIKQDMQAGKLVIVWGKTAVVQRNCLHLHLRHVCLGKYAGNLTGTVVTEVEENYCIIC